MDDDAVLDGPSRGTGRRAGPRAGTDHDSKRAPSRRSRPESQSAPGSAPGSASESAGLAEDAVSAFLHAPLAVAVCHPDGTVLRVNPAMTALLGYSPQDLLGRDLFRLLPDDLVAAAKAACAALRRGDVDTVVHETRFATATGPRRDVRVTTSAVRDTAPGREHLIMHLEDITDREDLRRRLQYEASHDSLTGLWNRARFLEELDRALPRGERHDQPVSVLYLDLDNFKAVNDRHGHAAGDRLLQSFGDHLRDCVRPEDTAARLGGDEFAVLCENTTAAQAAVVVERLTGGTWASAFTDLALGVAIGIATTPAAGTDTHGAADGDHGSAETLLHRADGDMYAVKARRGG
ncbi:GGDEF domain-containing protein [Kineococcus radiotolerans]|uniref:GGDEF domain-containing protein n=1 Tax=Kineococcus radiotolerans TaxID=131568 RepID=UPI00161B29EF|nr:sensor domain-containing diguanylate cyclase [Kineococcus radiotolerans]